jgi:hypothetical protein
MFLLQMVITLYYNITQSFEIFILVHTTKPSLNNSNDNPINSSVLLIYIYADAHKYAYGNLKYFVDNAVRERDGVDYIFIIQQIGNKEINETKLPLLPKSNAFYIQHENRCFDFGTIGWFFATYTIGYPGKDQSSITNNNNNNHRKFNLTQYKYFIFMNSSIRGPFFPPYFLKFLSDYQKEFNESFYWYYIFTKRINTKVKLVGCTISCGTALHVQSYFLTTDFIGLSVLFKAGNSDGALNTGVFACFPSKSDTIEASELGISKRILESDYMLDCLLTKYQKISFSKKTDFKCTVYGNPYADKNLDGTSLEPYEVVFVKFADREMTFDAQERAKLYQRWMEQQTETTNRTLW